MRADAAMESEGEAFDEFLKCFWNDFGAGSLRSTEAYVKMFPAAAEQIRREIAALLRRIEQQVGASDGVDVGAGQHASKDGAESSLGIYFSDDRSRMTVVHVHPDSSSLEQLLAFISPVLAPFRDLLRLRSIDVYGSPSDAVEMQLRAKVDLLGGTITIHRRFAGVDSDTLKRGHARG